MLIPGDCVSGTSGTRVDVHYASWIQRKQDIRTHVSVQKCAFYAWMIVVFVMWQNAGRIARPIFAVSARISKD